MTQKIKDPVIIILSDAHLGASKSQSFLLYEFLMEISRKQYTKDVKAVIIIGDFFDVCMDNCRNIQNDFSYIFDTLEEINKCCGPVVFSLGNHEILVTGNNEKKFTRRKLDFINDFKEPPFNQKNIAQYINIRRENDELKIDLYDSLKSFDESEDPIQSHYIKNVIPNIKKDFSFLLSHSHQLESVFSLYFAGALI